MKKYTSTRREFIKKTALGSAALITPTAISLCAPPPQYKKEKLGVALVGLGYYSTDLLAPALQFTQHCYLAGIVTGTPEKAAKWKAKYNIPDKNIYNYQNFDEIANNPDIDVVYVVLPNSMHKEYTIRAAKAGKHVWCEKPMAVTVQDCEEMIKACKDNKVSLSIGYRMQHEPNTMKLMDIVKNKKMGKTQFVSVATGFTASTGWKNPRFEKAMGGGALMDMGVYAIQAARYAVGEEPISVTAQHFTQRPEVFKEVDDTIAFTLAFPSGAIANCLSSFSINVGYLNVTFEKGFFNLSPFQSYSGINGSYSQGDLKDAIPNQQAKQMDDDAMNIKMIKPVWVGGEEGLKDIKVVQAIYEAVRTGQKVMIQ